MRYDISLKEHRLCHKQNGRAEPDPSKLPHTEYVHVPYYAETQDKSAKVRNSLKIHVKKLREWTESKKIIEEFKSDFASLDKKQQEKFYALRGTYREEVLTKIHNDDQYHENQLKKTEVEETMKEILNGLLTLKYVKKEHTGLIEIDYQKKSHPSEVGAETQLKNGIGDINTAISRISKEEKKNLGLDHVKIVLCVEDQKNSCRIQSKEYPNLTVKIDDTGTENFAEVLREKLIEMRDEILHQGLNQILGGNTTPDSQTKNQIDRMDISEQGGKTNTFDIEKLQIDGKTPDEVKNDFQEIKNRLPSESIVTSKSGRRFRLENNFVFYQSKPKGEEDYDCVWKNLSDIGGSYLDINGKIAKAKAFTDDTCPTIYLVENRVYDEFAAEYLRQDSGIYLGNRLRIIEATDNTWHTCVVGNQKIVWPASMPIGGPGPTVDIRVGRLHTEISFTTGKVVRQTLANTMWNLSEEERGVTEKKVAEVKSVMNELQKILDKYDNGNKDEARKLATELKGRLDNDHGAQETLKEIIDKT